MKTLYESITRSCFTRREIDESILDTDEEVKKEASVALFYTCVAENFTKIFGKLKPPAYKPSGFTSMGAIMNVRNWKFINKTNNEFINRINKMNKLIAREFPNLVFNIINCYSNVILGNKRGWHYTLQWKIDDTSLHEFSWYIVITEKDNVIQTILLTNPETVKDKEVINLLTDNLY